MQKNFLNHHNERIENLIVSGIDKDTYKMKEFTENLANNI